jgi:hypothetical protein
MAPLISDDKVITTEEMAMMRKEVFVISLECAALSICS